MRTAWALIPAVLLAACSGGSGDAASDQPSATGPPVEATAAPPSVPTEPLPRPDPGRARVVLGATIDTTLAVEECDRDPGAVPDGQVPAEQLVVVARGTRPDGVPVELDVRRFQSAGAASTITDTITVVEGPADAPERVSVAQRFEVGGQVTDPRDPEADDPLLLVREESITAAGIFAPPGAFADDGDLIAGRITISCTG